MSWPRARRALIVVVPGTRRLLPQAATVSVRAVRAVRRVRARPAAVRGEWARSR
ncbi:hypothetical protein [Streptomyces niveus]|uniref:hypothetical protein n=1 Tax=Streptomyces niveus TaxID=193462 RepID=UPI0034494CE7